MNNNAYLASPEKNIYKRTVNGVEQFTTYVTRNKRMYRAPGTYATIAEAIVARDLLLTTLPPKETGIRFDRRTERARNRSEYLLKLMTDAFAGRQGCDSILLALSVALRYAQADACEHNALHPPPSWSRLAIQISVAITVHVDAIMEQWNLLSPPSATVTGDTM